MRIETSLESFTIWLSASDTKDWATGYPCWPCSKLRGKRVRADFDTNGLLDLSVNGRPPTESLDLDCTELNAIIADHLKGQLPKGHPCFFVAVGQFDHA